MVISFEMYFEGGADRTCLWMGKRCEEEEKKQGYFLALSLLENAN